jgi:dipeptide/tripeptide permease
MSNTNRHPAGLWVLFTTEMWERFAFYAMRAILVLYLYDVSTNEQTPGFGWSEADAYELYGWYTGLVYLSPLLGGWIADRFLGQRSCVMIGAMLMAIGEFFLAATEFVRIGNGVKVTMASDPTALIVFLGGLGLIILGNGFFKPCISVMVGQLYAHGDQRRDSAFSIFYMGINIGAFFSPLVAGTVGEKYGYHLGFIIAGLGMICGLISFTMLGQKHLKGIGDAPTKHNPNDELTPSEKEQRDKATYEQTRPLVKQDWDRMFVIVVLSLFVIAFWLTFEQAGSSLNIFAKINTNRVVPDDVLKQIPEFATKNWLLNDENFVNYQKVVKRVQSLEKQMQYAASGGKQVEDKESFVQRVKRLFSFSAKVDERLLDEQIAELKTIAADLNVQLRKSKDPRVQDGISKLQEVIDEDDAAVLNSYMLYLKELGSDKAVTEIIESVADIESPAVAVEKIREGLRSHIIYMSKEDEEKWGRNIASRASHRNNLLAAIASILAHEQGSEGNEIQSGLNEMESASAKFGANYVPGKTSFTFPATWYQSVNAFGIVIFAPIFTLMWTIMARYKIEPSTPTKFALGLLLVSASFLVMIPGAVEAKATGGKAAAYWLVLCYLFATWGELCLSPVGLSMITKLAPARFASIFMGVWFTASSVAYILAGYAAKYFGSGEGISFFLGEKSGLADFFLLLALIPMVIGFIALAFAPMLKKMMHGIN